MIQTEISFDTVRVYNGSGTGGTLLYTQSGLFANFSFTSSENQTFTVRFTSDSNTQQAGFALTVTGIYAKNISIGGGTSSKTIRIGNISNSFPLILSGGTGEYAVSGVFCAQWRLSRKNFAVLCSACLPFPRRRI